MEICTLLLRKEESGLVNYVIPPFQLSNGCNIMAKPISFLTHFHERTCQLVNDLEPHSGACNVLLTGDGQFVNTNLHPYTDQEILSRLYFQNKCIYTALTEARMLRTMIETQYQKKNR